MPLDEKSLRKPGFTEGTRVRLADGQEWTFPKPWLRLYPARDADGKFYAAGGMSFGAEYEEKFDELIECPDDDLYRKLCLQVELAASLLASNYELTDGDLRRLLPIDSTVDGCKEMWEAIGGVLMGNPPEGKPSADGSATP